MKNLPVSNVIHNFAPNFLAYVSEKAQKSISVRYCIRPVEQFATNSADSAERQMEIYSIVCQSKGDKRPYEWGASRRDL